MSLPAYVLYEVKTGSGAVVLVLGILAWCGCGFFLGIPAWIMGNTVLADIDRGYVAESERGVAQAGRILGITNTVITLGVVCLWLALVASAVGISSTQTLYR